LNITFSYKNCYIWGFSFLGTSIPHLSFVFDFRCFSLWQWCQT
jgi:hypothetical protein